MLFELYIGLYFLFAWDIIPDFFNTYFFISQKYMMTLKLLLFELCTIIMCIVSRINPLLFIKSDIDCFLMCYNIPIIHISPMIFIVSIFGGLFIFSLLESDA